MKKKDKTDEEIEDELDRAFKENMEKRNVFSILKCEEKSADSKEKRTKKKIKFKSD